MMLDEQQVQQLLRLKRFEQPPPGYFEQALDELHHQMRAGSVNRSTRFSRLQEFFSNFNSFRVPQSAYAGAFAIFLVVATLMGTGVWSPRPKFDVSYNASAAAGQNNSAAIFGGRIQLSALKSDQQEIFPTIKPSDTVTPRYILGGQPVSYNTPSSF
ncbi:MAG TPA: hypothetical protein VN939_07460 [Chthoniobacterales bacterium]|jgi:hypothetical protein|nr:hypothetical protein [Chthoniobacterales bacterium]